MIQFSNRNKLLTNEVYTLFRTIARPVEMLDSEFPEDGAKKIYNMFKQTRIGLQQIRLAQKYPDTKFI